MSDILSTLTQFIANLGFPIAVCVACFWYITRENEAHKKEMMATIKIIDNNTLAVTKLTELLEKEDDK